MTSLNLLIRWRTRLAERAAARAKYEAIVYFDGPKTKWRRSCKNWAYKQQPGGLRVPLANAVEWMPPPDPSEIVSRKTFRSQVLAQLWTIAKLKGFDHSKIVGEVRPL